MVSLLGTAAAAYFGWRTDRRAMLEMSMKITDLQIKVNQANQPKADPPKPRRR